MNVGDKVWVEATVTSVGEHTVDVAIPFDGRAHRVTNVRTHKDAVRAVPGRKKAEA